jgi:hypothetical protein
LTPVAVSGGGGPKLVRLILVKDGIEFDASVALPDPMGTLTGRFLLAPRGDNGGLILRLLVSQLDQDSAAKWLGAWQRLAPNDDAAGALAGFDVRLSNAEVPAFSWRLRIGDGGAIVSEDHAVTVPGSAVSVRLLGPAGTDGEDGEADVRPDQWLLTGEKTPGALDPTSLQRDSSRIWKNAAQVDWGGIGNRVMQWSGTPVLTAVVLPKARPPPAGTLFPAPSTALSLAAALSLPADRYGPMTGNLIGLGSQPAVHPLAHDEVLLAQALRSVHGLRIVPKKQHRDFVREPVSCGIEGMDVLLGGGMDRGTSNLLMGPSGTGKSSLAITYAHSAPHEGSEQHFLRSTKI